MQILVPAIHYPRQPLCARCAVQLSLAACGYCAARRILCCTGSKSRAVEAWNKRMLGVQGPAQPSPALGDNPWE